MSQAKFEKAAEIIGSLPKDGPVKPTTDDQLYFYKYFKQAKFGDNTTTRPGLLDFAGKAKWDAWTEVKGTTAEEAYAKYVEKFFEMFKRADDEESKKHIAAVEAA
ncbi:Acyl-CoA-binding protein [Hypsizygus marmoreus]|uniref:Acyl-CoA-binding protein n=1 Tax=Hypsizygus marmoreus TaxID=39966 RepID=A0A369K2W4_HYPMA|nr:Acyl-CoA-binding protein [Hypsizygus marmoreus]